MKPNEIDNFINNIDGLEEFLIELNNCIVAENTIYSSVEALSIAANVSVDDSEEEENLLLPSCEVGVIEAIAVCQVFIHYLQLSEDSRVN